MLRIARCNNATRTLPLSPALSPEYRGEGVRATTPRLRDNAHIEFVGLNVAARTDSVSPFASIGSASRAILISSYGHILDINQA